MSRELKTRFETVAKEAVAGKSWHVQEGEREEKFKTKKSEFSFVYLSRILNF